MSGLKFVPDATLLNLLIHLLKIEIFVVFAKVAIL